MFGDKKRYDNYVIETVEHNGKPKERSVYVGALLAYDSPKLAMRVKIYLCIVGAYLVAAFLASGFSAFYNNVIYVLIPYVLQVVTIALYIMSVANIVMFGVVVKESDLGRSIDRIRPVCIVQAVLAGVSAIGDLFFVAFDPAFSSIAHECTFMVFNLLSVVASAFGAVAVKLFKFHEIENPEIARIDKKREEQKQIDFLLELERKQKIREQSKRANDAKKRKKKKK